MNMPKSGPSQVLSAQNAYLWYNSLQCTVCLLDVMMSNHDCDEDGLSQSGHVTAQNSQAVE